jgi:hypothetical protein
MLEKTKEEIYYEFLPEVKRKIEQRPSKEYLFEVSSISLEEFIYYFYENKANYCKSQHVSVSDGFNEPGNDGIGSSWERQVIRLANKKVFSRGLLAISEQVQEATDELRRGITVLLNQRTDTE